MAASTDNLAPKIESLQEQIGRLNQSVTSLTNVIERSMRAQDDASTQLMELYKLIADKFDSQIISNADDGRY
ncbi:hypothetical protein MMAS_13390 [Mycobacteroides abscessus subsp. massiliense CCUG 48898 = JCM 15300]|nr:hypothetical protein MMAS_13390 [Mycobacteroides abscessus subsp. massiliense CCUG 48898 = JCM 15300]